MDSASDHVAEGADVFGDRWTLLILRDIVFEDRRNFRALLLGSRERIASNILADRLVRLVEAGLLVRGEGRRGQRTTYSLTEAGIQSVPILYQLAAWGARWRGGDGDGRPLTAHTDDMPVDALIAELRSRHLSDGAT
ncbi:winged helix-turn-helix transcriptional regulator [Leifsonia virtsii]|uniref:Helix-turn-helix domain-containing protein n=1 Tax=Leifsonia virtsii TaxID=3035915 RepID=A0ABT8J1N0_9MICO|nr:helix-turn-helix domain-containing protein [Leifsonia virtsii]MDN4598960.1 helix-turn-helix domain-containing protein [Leifsonia virtsii]